MNLESFIKYLIWIFIFAIALTGIYTLLNSLGAI